MRFNHTHTPHRAYWGYHSQLPSRAQRLYESLDPQQQRHINDEKVAMEKGGVARPASSLGVRSHKRAPPPVDNSEATPELTSLKKALSSIANINPTPSSPPGPRAPPGPTSPTTSVPAMPAFRIQRPTVRISNKKPPLQSGGSSDNLLSGGPQTPVQRPSSRSGIRSGIRPPSRGAGMLHKKKSSDLLLPGRPGSGMRLSRSHQPSPAHRYNC